MDYFEHIVNRLNIDDMQVLGILHDENITAKFKALRKKELFERSGQTQANFRKTICRLEALNFIEIETGSKQHKYYITDYGLFAIEKSLEREVV